MSLKSCRYVPHAAAGHFSDANFRFCASGPEHLILIDRSGVAWSWGRGPQTGRIKFGAEEEGGGCGGQIALTRIDFFQVFFLEEGIALFGGCVTLLTHNIFQGLKITSVSSGDRFNVVLAEPTSPRTASDPSWSTPVASPKKCEAVPSRRGGKRISCPLGLPLESGKGGKKSDQNDDVELRKSKGAIS